MAGQVVCYKSLLLSMYLFNNHYFQTIGTGISKNGFSISGNERSLGGSIIEDSLEALLLGGTEVGVFVRNVRTQLLYTCYNINCHLLFTCVQVLTDAKSYDEAVSMLSKHYIAAPVYYIVAGSKPGEGVVITRDRNILSNLWQINVPSSDPNGWYVLETNYVSCS